MSDIVERLRAIAKPNSGCHLKTTSEWQELCTRSADEIERLRATHKKVGSIVAAARLDRLDKSRHHLAVYGAIGKCVLEMDEWDEYFAALIGEAEEEDE